MTLTITVKALLVWLSILLLAIANGLLREAVLAPLFGPVLALIASGIVLAALIQLTAFVALPWLGRTSALVYGLIGLLWLLTTLIFEFGFGIVQGHSMAQLFEAYMFKDGNIWPLVLVVTAVAPYVAAKVKGWV